MNSSTSNLEMEICKKTKTVSKEMTWDSVVSISDYAMRWMIQGLNLGMWQQIYPFSETAMALRPTQPPVQWAMGGFSLRVKQTGP